MIRTRRLNHLLLLTAGLLSALFWFSACDGDTEEEAPGPVIVAFTAEPDSIVRGEETTIAWETRNANRVTITELGEQEDVLVSIIETSDEVREGSMQLSPTETTMFQLRAVNPDGAEVFSACTTLRRSGEQVADLFHDHNHLTVLGNRLVGRALAGRLRELIRK